VNADKSRPVHRVLDVAPSQAIVALVVALLTGGCPDRDDDGADASDTSELSDTADASDTSNASDASDTLDAFDASDASDTADTADTSAYNLRIERLSAPVEVRFDEDLNVAVSDRAEVTNTLDDAWRALSKS
jgi:cytoskeletal protein RodZ